jgi:hypothetical protein
MMSEDMSAYVYAGTHASSQNDIATETPMVHASISDGFIAGKVRHEVGYVAAYTNNRVHSMAYTNVCASAMSPYPEGDNICSSVGDVVGVSANISEDDRTGQCFANVYSKFTCSAACYRGNDDI